MNRTIKTVLSIAQDAAHAYLKASERLDGEELERESKCIRYYHEIAAAEAGINIADIDALFDETTAELTDSPFGAPTEEDVCRAVLNLKEADK